MEGLDYDDYYVHNYYAEDPLISTAMSETTN